MKKYFNFPLFTVCAVSLLCSISACSNDDNPVGTPDAKNEQFKEIAEQYVNKTVIPTYKGLARYTESLVTKLQAVKENQTNADVRAACEVFLQARAYWEISEAFLYGAATDFGIDPHIDSWPLDLDGLKTALKNSGQVEAMGGEDGDVYAGEKLGNSLLGFHGIEYILFKEGAAKPISEISALELTYAIAVAGDLRNRCFQLELAWAGENGVDESHFRKVAEELELPFTVNSGNYSYAENMLNASRAGSTYSSWTNAMEAIVDGCKTIADEVGTSKIGKPHNGEDINYIESPYSHESITDFYDNIISIENTYMGGMENDRDESRSLHAYIGSVNAALDAKVTTAIGNALTKIKAMKAPFVLNYKDPSAGEAISACKELDAVLSEVKAQLRK